MMKVLCVNINGYPSKAYELEDVVHRCAADVVIIQETKMKRIPEIAEFKTIYSIPRSTGVLGSAILVRKTLIAEKLLDLPEHGMEVVGIQLELVSGKTIKIIGAYNPPTNKLPVKAISDLLKGETSTFLLGDLNAKCDIPLHANTNRNGDALDEEASYGELIVISPDTYTRRDYATRDPSCIDLALTWITNVHLVESLAVLEEVGSDHFPILLTLNCCVKKETMESSLSNRPNFHKADWMLFRQLIDGDIKSAPEVKTERRSIDDAVRFVTDSVLKAEAKAIPRKRIPNPSRRPVPRHILELIHKRQALRKVFWESKARRVKTEINRLDRKIKQAKLENERETLKRRWDDCKEKGPHGFFGLARKILTPRNHQTNYPLKYSNGTKMKTDEEKILAFQELYRGIYQRPEANPQYLQIEEDANSYYSHLRDRYSSEIAEHCWREISPTVGRSDVTRELKKTKDTAPGSDGISYAHLKNLPVCAYDYLAKIFECSIKSCYFPTDWKSGLVKLIPKTGKDHSSVLNYRPITLLVTLGKVFERIIKSKLNPFIESNNILPESQAGFRQARSTQDQLFKLAQDAAESVNTGGITIASFFDVQKAYDKVWLQGLALKMRNCGIPETMTALLMDYASNRTIHIKLNNSLSDSVCMHCGLAQGSIINPILHNIWVSDIPQPGQAPSEQRHTKIKLSQFADDIATWVNARKTSVARSVLQEYNDTILEYCRKWKITLSPGKTQVIGFGDQKYMRKEEVFQVIEDQSVNHSDSITFLGIQFDSDMTWRSHSEALRTRLKQRIGLFPSITGSVRHPRADNKLCLRILKSMIVPLIYYAPTVLCARTKHHFEQQDQLIARAARLALHIPRTIGRPYVQSRAGIQCSQERTRELARKYLTDPRRSISLKEAYKKAVVHVPTRTTIMTPGQALHQNPCY